ncbi:hypothetical protein EX30DRAFT_341748 [Ascodesmis nigricans]|uniref:D-lactate dehydrogenase n=1 Tax=Ascodesmis nigricans TaxID=341454 RepID=A0A4S2MUC6_9PEZI|nr:hypothetical protein EX30DRAFT_341748 [Ascodesmis nigricans]
MSLKVAVFASKRYDMNSLTDANNELRTARPDEAVEFSFLEPRLDSTTAALAAGHDAVCIFVNDVCDREALEQLKSNGVKYIALRCAGFDNVDLAAAADLGIRVARVPAYSPDAVAEFAVGMILTIVRKYHKSYSRVREGNFLLDGLVGFNLSGKTVGILGTGKIGLLTGRILARGFGCRVIAYDVFPSKQAEEYGISYVDTLKEMLEQSDIVSLHCPLMDSTKYIINDETLGQMKRGAVLVNTSRGALIDTIALIRALKRGHLGAVGIDVYEKESAYFFADSSDKIIYDDNFARLLSFYNVFVSGHQAFLTDEALKNIADTTLSNLRAFETKGECVNEVKA